MEEAAGVYSQREKLLQNVLPEFNGEDSFCRNNKLGFFRDENDCDKMSDICKWGRKDGEGKERCMKDEDKILALKQKPKKKGWNL